MKYYLALKYNMAQNIFFFDNIYLGHIIKQQIQQHLKAILKTEANNTLAIR